jgi:hypothetical protein
MIDQRRPKRKIISVSLIALVMVMVLSLPSISCDRLILLTGTVYEWVNPPPSARSKIYHKEYSTDGLLSEDIPEGINLQPLVDAAVHSTGRINDRKNFDDTGTTDSKGEFRIAVSIGQITEDFTTSVVVSKAGYYAAVRDIKDSGSSHALNVILVRK